MKGFGFWFLMALGSTSQCTQITWDLIKAQVDLAGWVGLKPCLSNQICGGVGGATFGAASGWSICVSSIKSVGVWGWGGCTCVWEGAGRGLCSSPPLLAPLASESSLCALMISLYIEKRSDSVNGLGWGFLLATVPLDPLLGVAQTPS